MVGIIGFEGEPAVIPDMQIEALKRLVFSILPCDPYPYITEGDRMEITRGPLQGLQGNLIEKKGVYRFILSIDLIQQAVACEIDACDVEKVG